MPASIDAIVQTGMAWWPLQLARELDDAILCMRSNELDIGLWLIKTVGSAKAVLQSDDIMLNNKDHWFVRETLGLLRRTFARLDVSSRSLFALVDEGSCFAGSLLEPALACDRIYMLTLPDDEERTPNLTVGIINFGFLPMVTRQSRLARRFYDDSDSLQAIKALTGKGLDGDQAERAGLITYALDDIDWDDEVRLAIEERVSMSPDALTGMEANLRFNGPENMWTRIFGRLTAWQNWIFIRPNAVGDKGALKLYGKGEKPSFDRNRV